MHTTFEEFLKEEKYILRSNIERLQRRLKWYSGGEPISNGHRQMLDVQLQHVKLFDSLAEENHDAESLLFACQNALHFAEQEYQRTLSINKAKYVEHWESVKEIHFLLDLITHLKEWQQIQ